MSFHRERRLFFKKDRGIIHKPLQLILLSGVLCVGFAAHFFDMGLSTQYGSGHEQTMSRFAFSPQGIWAFQADKAVRVRQTILTGASMEARLTTPPLVATSENPLIVSPKKNVRSDGDAPVRVRVISHSLSAYSPAPISILSDNVNIPENKKLPDVVRAVGVQRGEQHSAPTSWLDDEPPEIALTTATKVDEGVSEAKLQPKVAKPRQISVRSRRSRARAKRSSNPVGQSLVQNLPKWADTALFNSGN